MGKSVEKEKQKNKIDIDIDDATVATGLEVDQSGEIKELNDKLLRQFAEFDNFKKRTAREKLELAEFTKAGCFTEILSVVDNFERALDCESKDEGFKKGMEMILSQLKAALQKQGVIEIEAEGKPFDPTFHNAINQVADETKTSGDVHSVLQKGYMLGERVIRHAMVAVVE